MKHKCSPFCFYFPSESYGGDYEIDKNGVKRRHKTHYCKYDNEKITNWTLCNYYAPLNKRKPKIILMLGKSASGKDTAIKYLTKIEGISPLVSYTTRPIRENEQDGIDYKFISDEQFLKMEKNKEFMEKREYNTLFNNKKAVWRYGISLDDVMNSKDILITAVDIDGYYHFLKQFRREELLVIYIDSDKNTRKQRAKQRGSFSESEWNRRLKDDEEKFEYYNVKKVIDYIITNNDSLEDFYKELTKILKNEGTI